MYLVTVLRHVGFKKNVLSGRTYPLRKREGPREGRTVCQRCPSNLGLLLHTGHGRCSS